MKKTLRNILTAGTIGLASLLPARKAEAQNPVDSLNLAYPQCQPPEYATPWNAQRVLGVRNISFIDINLPDGYKAHRATSSQLRALAGIYAGTAHVRRENDDYLIVGTYSQLNNPEALRRVLREADTNCDKIITREEERALTRRMLGN